MSDQIEIDDEFYRTVVAEFFQTTRARHGKVPLIRQFQYGVALCELPLDFESYFMALEASARRNVRKAEKSGYHFGRIEFNDYLDDIREIRQSTRERQGKVPAKMLSEDVAPHKNPQAKTNVHDYPHFGVLKEGRLFAYAGCLVAGELGMIEHILGHDDYQPDGIVPLLITSIADDLLKNHPRVKYYGYGTYYGAGPSMRRFKKKFGFIPYRVKWVLS